MVAFPRLFSLALVQDGRVDEFYDTNPERGRWMFGWRRDLFEWEKDLNFTFDEVGWGGCGGWCGLLGVETG